MVKYDSVKESHEAWRKNESFFEKLSSWYDVNVRMRIHDFFYNKKSMRFLKKTGHHREESYSLDTHIIDDIIFNVPIIKADKHGYPQHFCDKAVLELHKNEKSFDLDEFYSKNNWKTDKNVEDLAMAMYQAELDKLLLNARLYVYYSSYGIIDETNNDEVELDKKWHKTLPYRPGRYKELDYRKLHALEDKCWNSVFNWMKAYGRFLWT